MSPFSLQQLVAAYGRDRKRWMDRRQTIREARVARKGETRPPLVRRDCMH